jgi:hypothetical protein
MAVKHTNILPSKAFQNMPTLGFFWNADTPSGNPAPNTDLIIGVMAIR